MCSSDLEKGAIEQAMNDGWVSANTASKLIEEVDLNLTSHVPAIESPVPPNAQRLIETWIDEAERRAWFLFEATR